MAILSCALRLRLRLGLVALFCYAGPAQEAVDRLTLVDATLPPRHSQPFHTAPRCASSLRPTASSLVFPVLPWDMPTSLASSCSRILFLGFALLSSLVTTAAFTPLYSPATQCGSFTVSWAGSNVTTGPPFILLVLPLDASPTILKLPDSSFDATTKTGKYTLDKLPLKSGAQFIVTMDDGYGMLVSNPETFRPLTRPSRPLLLTGRGTGGVSLIQTVGASSDTSCLPADVSSTSSFFTLNPSTPSQCAAQTVAWNSTRYRQPPDIRGFIPGGQSFTLDRPTSNSTTQQDWDVHIREGTQIVFLVQPAASNQNTSDARTSQLITVTGKSSQGDGCLDTNSPSSTVESASITSIPTVPGTTDPSGNVK